MKHLEGVIQEDGTVLCDKVYYEMPVRGTDSEGYKEVLLADSFARQSIKYLIGKEVHFVCNKIPFGFNYTLKNKPEEQE